MVVLKSEPEIALMRRAGRAVARAIRQMSGAIVPGRTTTGELDTIAEYALAELGARPAFKGYRSYPATACISVNDEVVHGIPGPRTLQEGDIVGLDVGAVVEGFYADGAWTVAVGSIPAETQRLLNVTQEAMWQGIGQAKVGNTVGDISSTIQRYVERNGYSVVRDLSGHGVGRAVHEEPNVPNYGRPGKGERLRPGMTICIEPMVNIGTYKVHSLGDNWTIVTDDGGLSAHFEHTVAITRSGAEILTTEDGD